MTPVVNHGEEVDNMGLSPLPRYRPRKLAEKKIRKNADNMLVTLKIGEFQVVFKFLLNNDTRC